MAMETEVHGSVLHLGDLVCVLLILGGGWIAKKWKARRDRKACKAIEHHKCPVDEVVSQDDDFAVCECPPVLSSRDWPDFHVDQQDRVIGYLREMAGEHGDDCDHYMEKGLNMAADYLAVPMQVTVNTREHPSPCGDPHCGVCGEVSCRHCRSRWP